MPINNIPSDFPSFEWDISNGSATAEQTAKAYATISGVGGACVDFSHKVWNDIVDMLHSVLLCIDMEWDATYANIDETRMSETLSDRHLTAARFNSVRHNINRCVGCLWLWQTETDREGYTGRLDMRGVKTHGRNADVVRGWYLDELVFIMNILIRAWRGDEDAVSAFESLHNAIAPRKVGFDVFDLHMISVLRNSISNSEKNLRAFPLILESLSRSSASQIHDGLETFPLIRAQSFSAFGANVRDGLDVHDAIFHKSIHAAQRVGNSLADVHRIANVAAGHSAILRQFENLNCYDIVFETVKKSMERLSSGNADVFDIINLVAFENAQRQYFGNVVPLDIRYLKRYRDITSTGAIAFAAFNSAMVGAVENSRIEAIDRLSVSDAVLSKATENAVMQYGARLDCHTIADVTGLHSGIMLQYANVVSFDIRYVSAFSNLLYQDFASFEPKSIDNLDFGGKYAHQKYASVFFPPVVNRVLLGVSRSSAHGLLSHPDVNTFTHGGISASDFKGSFSFPQIAHGLLLSNRQSLTSASLSFLYSYSNIPALRGLSKRDFTARLGDFNGDSVKLKSVFRSASNAARLRIDNHLRHGLYPYHAAAQYNSPRADTYDCIMFPLGAYHANAPWKTPSMTIYGGVVCEVKPYHAAARWEIPNMTTHERADLITSDKHAKVVSNANIETIRGYARFKNVYSNTTSQGQAIIDEFAPGKIAGTEINAKSASSASVDGVGYVEAAVVNHAQRKSHAAMKVIRSSVEWYDPIEEGDNLHIRSVWTHDPNGDNVHIG